MHHTHYYTKRNLMYPGQVECVVSLHIGDGIDSSPEAIDTLMRVSHIYLNTLMSFQNVVYSYTTKKQTNRQIKQHMHGQAKTNLE